MSDIITGLCKALSAFAVCSVAWLLLGLAISGCATPAPAETFIVADYVEPEPDPAPSLVVDEPTEAAPAESVVVPEIAKASVGGCSCGPDCQCCKKQHVGDVVEHQNGKYVAEWVWHPAAKTQSPPALQPPAFDLLGGDCEDGSCLVPMAGGTSACATGNCGTSTPGRTIRRGRLFGRR